MLILHCHPSGIQVMHLSANHQVRAQSKGACMPNTKYWFELAARLLQPLPFMALPILPSWAVSQYSTCPIPLQCHSHFSTVFDLYLCAEGEWWVQVPLAWLSVLRMQDTFQIVGICHPFHNWFRYYSFFDFGYCLYRLPLNKFQG